MSSHPMRGHHIGAKVKSQSSAESIANSNGGVSTNGVPASSAAATNHSDGANSKTNTNDFKTKAVLKEAVDAVVTSFAKHSHGYGRGTIFIHPISISAHRTGLVTSICWRYLGMQRDIWHLSLSLSLLRSNEKCCVLIWHLNCYLLRIGDSKESRAGHSQASQPAVDAQDRVEASSNIPSIRFSYSL